MKDSTIPTPKLNLSPDTSSPKAKFNVPPLNNFGGLKSNPVEEGQNFDNKPAQ